MSPYLRTADHRLGLIPVLFAFWMLFWLLNGGDKFFNGTSAVNPAVTQAVVLDGQGAVVQRVHPTQPQGWYGVTRDAKFIAYFRTLHLSPQVALTVLYTIGVVQLVLGSLFLLLLYWSIRPAPARPRHPLYAQRVLHRLAFKASAMVFYVFCVGDIFFGDRLELWEHGTYLLLTLVSWQAWYRADQHSALAADSEGLPVAQQRVVPSKTPVALP